MAKGKVIIVGANQTGLALCLFLGKAGFSVEVFEKKKQVDVSYDWHDDINPDIFNIVGLPLPPSDCYFEKKCWTFVPPNKSDYIFVEIEKEKRDMSIERKPFNDYLFGLAKDFGKFHYETEVDSLIIENEKITGVKLKNGDKIFADLVADASGVNSKLRENLPKSFGFENKIDKSDTFVVRRTFYDVDKSIEPPKYTNKVYLKHMGRRGISWSIYNDEKKTADILIGSVGNIEKDTIEAALLDLQQDNPHIGKKILKGGEICTIPVRRPASRLFWDGYVILGDSAFMTIPMLGSGVANGIRAAKFLSDVLSEPTGNAYSNENLYRYQMGYFKAVGAKHSGIDLMKRWLLNSPPHIIDALMQKRIIGEQELAIGGMGEDLTLSVKQILQKVFKGIGHIPTLLKLKLMLDNMAKQVKIASNLPENYTAESFRNWQEKYNKNFLI